MAALKMLNLMAVASLAMFASTLYTPVDALSAGHQHLNRHVPHVHDAIAKKKRGANGRCKPKPSSSSAILSTTAALPVTTSAAPVTTAPATTKAHTTTTSVAPVTTVASSGGSGKIGISFDGNNNAAWLANLISDNVGYHYNWSPWKPSNTYGLTYIPMMWGPKQQSDWDKLVVAGYAHTALGFNEPDQSGQSEMDAGYAASYWKSQVGPKQNLGYDLWGPAPTGSDRGEQWMDDFLAACAGECSFSHMAVHFYDTDPQKFITLVEHWHSKYGKPMVITEIACQNFGSGSQATMDEIWAFWQTVIPYAMSQDWITAIFPFAFLADMANVNPLNRMMDTNGQLTDLGKYAIYGPY